METVNFTLPLSDYSKTLKSMNDRTFAFLVVDLMEIVVPYLYKCKYTNRKKKQMWHVANIGER